MNVVLQIHYLDDGHEADVVASATETAAARAGLTFARPVDDNHSVLIASQPLAGIEDWQALPYQLAQMQNFLAHIETADLKPIRELGLHITLRIHHTAQQLAIDPSLLKECARLDIPLLIWNDTFLSDGIVAH